MLDAEAGRSRVWPIVLSEGKLKGGECWRSSSRVPQEAVVDVCGVCRGVAGRTRLPGDLIWVGCGHL